MLGKSGGGGGIGVAGVSRCKGLIGGKMYLDAESLWRGGSGIWEC
jgi:hypothetical protein